MQRHIRVNVDRREKRKSKVPPKNSTISTFISDILKKNSSKLFELEKLKICFKKKSEILRLISGFSRKKKNISELEKQTFAEKKELLRLSLDIFKEKQKKFQVSKVKHV